ncbi:MAG: transposase [Candidatus Aerophobetes bacterium]|nr:transposase [Candidatus Aerophobetes bacterium]
MSLPKVRAHKEYQEFVKEQLKAHSLGIPTFFMNVYAKLINLDLSRVNSILKFRYSNRGTPARAPDNMLRSLLAMMLSGITSIDEWIALLRSFPSLAIISGFTPEDTPGVGTFYDFFDRLYLMDKDKSKTKGKIRFRRKPNKSKEQGKREDALPEHNHKGVIQRLVNRVMREDSKKKNNKSSYKAPDYLLQKIFKECFVIPSARLGIIDLDNLNVGGDGSKIATYASPYGKKVCKCKDKCDCPRLFSDRDARWGWDSFHESWVYGYGIHDLVDLKSGLSIILPKLTSANIHDGVVAINLIREAMNQGYRIKHSVFDSDYDNYHFYRFLIDYYRISPIIKINKRCEGKFKNRDLIFFTKDGAPICLYGLTLTNWGYCWDRGRNKWRCPICSLAQYKDEECPYRDICQQKKSKYGRVVYTRSKENYRYFTPVPRDSDLWKELYKKRSISERSFKVKKRDYKLTATRTRGRKMWAIRVALACMCQHIDAQAKALGVREEKSQDVLTVT